MKKPSLILAVLTAAAGASFAQANDPTKAYIASGFAAMDFNKDGKVTPAEFDRFMRGRLERQTAAFDAAFAKLDADSDGKIGKQEAGVNAQLAEHFAEIDLNADGGIDKEELRSAMLKAHAAEQGIN